MGAVVRVGVTGHRSIPDPTSAVASIDAVLDRIQPAEAAVVAVSALGEGADRLVVERVLVRARSSLEVILPLSGDDYADDFSSDASRRRFAELLATATSVEIVPGEESGDTHVGWSRQEAYARAARAVVDRSDVLIAVWDGAATTTPGSTPEVIQYAVERGVAVELVLISSAGTG